MEIKETQREKRNTSRYKEAEYSERKTDFLKIVKKVPSRRPQKKKKKDKNK